MADEKEQDKAAQPNSETDNASGDGTQPVEKSGEKLFTQAELDRLIDDRLKRERMKSEEQSKKAREEAEAKTMEEQKKYQELAEQRAARLSELQPEVDKAKRYGESLTKLLEVEKANVPPHVLALLEKLDPADQLTWIADNRDALKAGETPDAEPPRKQGIPQTPPRGDKRGMTEEQDLARKERVRRSYQSAF